MKFNQLILFIKLSSKKKLLYVEAIARLFWAKTQVSKPISELVAKMGETPLETRHDDLKTIKEISEAVQIMSKYTIKPSMCLVRAIAAMRMLEKRQIESTLYLGTSKDENGNLLAHAWLRSGPYILTGASEMHNFTVVGKFAKTIS